MYSEELKLEKQRHLEKQLWRCGKCKFSEYNCNIAHINPSYCHIREEHMDKSFVGDFFAILFCSHFKRVEK